MSISKVLVPTDFTEASQHAIVQAMKILDPRSLQVDVIHILDVTGMVGIYGDAIVTVVENQISVRDAIARDLDYFAKKISEAYPVQVNTFIREGSPSEEICQHAKDRSIDLIVMATHGRQGLPRFFLGSVTERVIRLSDIPVLTFRFNEADV